MPGVDLDIPLRQVVQLVGGRRARRLAEVLLLGESRRRYVLSMTPFERERLGGIPPRGEADAIDGLPPAQRLPGESSGDVAGHLHLAGDLTRRLRERSAVRCPACGGPAVAVRDDEAPLLAGERHGEQSLLVIAPMRLRDPASARVVVAELERAGFRRLRLGGEVLRFDALPQDLQAEELHVVVDRLSATARTPARLGEALRTARGIGAGRVQLVDDEGRATWCDLHRACLDCGHALAEPDWQAILRGAEAAGVELQGQPAGPSMARLSLGDLQEWGEEDSPTARRLADAARRAADLGLQGLPLWRPVADLAHGERLRLGIAAARQVGLAGVLHVVTSPPSALDEACRRRVAAGLRALVDEGASVVVLDDDDAGEIGADSVVVIEQEGEPAPAPAPRRTASAPRAPVSEVEQIIVEAAAPASGEVPAARVVLPVEGLTLVTGPSGSGKTRLLRLLREASPRVRAPAVKRVVDVTPAAAGEELLVELLGVHRPLARLFADTPVAREAGLDADAFLRQRPGGRCPTCEGRGRLHHRLDVVEDVITACHACGGRRFRDPVLAVTARGLSLADALSMSVSVAAAHFRRDRAVGDSLAAAAANGLGELALDELEADLDETLRLLARLTRQQGAQRRGDMVLVDRPAAGADAHRRACVEGALRRLVDGGSGVLVADASDRWRPAADLCVELPGGTS